MGSYPKAIDSGWYKHRLTGAMFCVIGTFLILIIRLFYLQIIEGEEYRRLSENQCIRLQAISAPRGVIYDRSGILLVDNRPSYDLNIVIKDASPLDDTIKKLSQYTNISEKEFKDTLKTSRRVADYKPLLLKKDIDRDMLAAIETHKFDLPGIVIDVKTKREYIYEKSAAHLIGYLGEISAAELKSDQYQGFQGGDYVGKFGVEKSAESMLRGKNGGRQVEVNAKGQVVRVFKTVEAVPGYNIYLTIEHDLQKKAESLLEDKVGGVVVMECDSGKILAMASSPSFDQNLFVRGMNYKQWNDLISNPDRPMENKVVNGEYPPASTYKVITAMAGLEEAVVDEKTSFYCPGYYHYGDRTFRCWKKSGHGRVAVKDALAVSCDVYFYQVGQRLGVDRIAKYAKMAGLGKPTGIQLGQEASGLIPTSAWKKKKKGIPWQKGETLSIAIGQGYNLATPLQMCVLFSAVANNGRLYQPLVIEKALDDQDNIVFQAEKKLVGTISVSQKTMDIVKAGLWEVVNGRRGTAKIIAAKEFDIYGKTGTAQVVSRPAGDDSPKKNIKNHLKPHAWFVGYGIKDGQKIAASVMIEHGEHGSSTAAPIVGELIKAYFQKKQVENDYLPITGL
ncbi:Penicillin-binding protein 2 [Desulfonema limicola]|uniref:Penicillin-binding protein 2 n=1 Tax=Desulfonema limicola TaxID=45656 RepID=A0A975B4F7_9BACT|nr:penicillin-binding protein 2 [Desulfonema limicola]QTA78579.1 Penicillin-binding protein 2 [Desulfonema limicola]